MKDSIIYSLLGTGGGLVFLALVFIPMEKAFPAKPEQATFRPKWLIDACYMLGQYVFWSGAVFWVLDQLDGVLIPWIPAIIPETVQQQAWGWQVLEVLLLSDLLIYWGHRLQHQVPFLWRFHKVHHSAPHLDWLAAYREHPLDSIYTIGLINFPAFVMGFPLETIAGITAFRGIWAIYIHSNVRMPIGPLKMLIGAPELHHWHHDLDRYAGNYANLSPIMDIIFGTYSCPDHEPEAVGIREEVPKTYIGQLLEPCLPKNWWEKVGKRL